jgi:hypothetical protein
MNIGYNIRARGDKYQGGRTLKAIRFISALSFSLFLNLT